MNDPQTEGLAQWAVAAGQRIAFHARRRREMRAELDAVLQRLRAVEPEAALRAFLHACLGLLTDVAGTRADLAGRRDDIVALVELARAAIEGDCDDRPVNAQARPLFGLPGAAGYAVLVPGRVVWLAAMAAQVPDEEGAAAVMLVNDLAAVDMRLPLRALRAAAGGGA